MKRFFSPIKSTALLILLCACGGNKDESSTQTNSTEKKVDSLPTNTKGPIINIEDTVEVSQTFICVKDTAKSDITLQAKLASIYNTKLPEAVKIGKGKIIGSPTIWNDFKKGIYYFEAGLPIENALQKMPKGMYTKATGKDSVLVAHFWGPQSLIGSAYEVLFETLKEKKKNSSNSYVVFVGNHFDSSQTDPYKLKTDIVIIYK
jgi:hypothetical protein